MQLRHFASVAARIALLSGATCLPAGACAEDLLSIFRLALEGDPTYLAARATALAGKEALPQARSQLLPNISASGSRGKNDTLESNSITGASVFSNYTSSSTAITLRQPLYRKYQFAAYEQAEAQVINSDAVLDKERQDLAIRVSNAYFEALLAEEQLQVIETQKTAYATQLALAKRALSAGSGTRTDIDEAQAKWDLANAQSLEARQLIENTRRLLQNLARKPVQALAVLVAGKMQLVEPNPPALADWVNKGLEANPEIRALKAAVDVSRQEVEKARAGHFPTVDLVAQRSNSQSDTNYTINREFLTNSIGVQFSAPIFAAGYVNSQVRQAEALLEKARQQMDASKIDLELQVQKDFYGVVQGVVKIKALEQALRSAEQMVYSTRKGYLAGMRTSLDILNAEQQKAQVNRELVLARYQYVLARLRLQARAGSLGENELHTINQWLDYDPRPPVLLTDGPHLRLRKTLELESLAPAAEPVSAVARR